MNERGPVRGGLKIVLVLTAVVIATTIAASVLIAAMVVPVAAALLANEMERSSPALAISLVRFAARLLPKRARNDKADEWTDQVLCEVDAGLRPLFTAVAIACKSAPRFAVRLWAGPVAGRYILAFVAITLELGMADPDEAHRGSLRSACKALVRTGSLWTAPFVAVTGIWGRRARLPRWMLYGVGTVTLIAGNEVFESPAPLAIRNRDHVVAFRQHAPLRCRVREAGVNAPPCLTPD